MNDNTRCSLITVESDDVKKLKGLIRIDGDLLTLIDLVNFEMEKCRTSNCKHFHGYHGIIIIYRKLFSKDNREAVLSFIDLKDVSNEQKDLHKKLIELRNKHVAHTEKTEYDPVKVFMIIDNNSGKALDIKINQALFEPLSCQDFINILNLLNVLRNCILQNIEETKREIIDEHNRSIESQLFAESK